MGKFLSVHLKPINIYDWKFESRIENLNVKSNTLININEIQNYWNIVLSLIILIQVLHRVIKKLYHGDYNFKLLIRNAYFQLQKVYKLTLNERMPPFSRQPSFIVQMCYFLLTPVFLNWQFRLIYSQNFVSSVMKNKFVRKSGNKIK